MDSVKGFFSGLFCLLLVSVLSLLGLVITLKLTVLKPDFTLSELKRLDVYSLAAKQVESFLQGQGISSYGAEMAFVGLERGLEQEVENVVRSIYESLDRGELSTPITLSGIKVVVRDYATKVLSSLPESRGAPTSDIEEIVSRIYGEIDGMIPEAVLLGESMLGAGITPQLSLVNQLLGYIRAAHRVLAVVAVALVLLICLVHWWHPKPVVQALGSVFIIVGVGCVISSLFGFLGDLVFGFLSVPDATFSRLQSSLFQLFSDILKPMRMYGFGFLGAGICLILVSVLWKPAPATSRALANQSGRSM